MKFAGNKAKILNFFANSLAKPINTRKNTVPIHHYSTLNHDSGRHLPSTSENKNFIKQLQSSAHHNNFMKDLRLLIENSQNNPNPSPENLEAFEKTNLNKQQDDTGITKLHYAIISNVPSWAKILLKYGAQSDIKDKRGFFAADYCSNPSKEMMEIFNKYDVKRSKTSDEIEESQTSKPQDIGKKLIGAIIFGKKEVFDQIINDKNIKINFEEIRAQRLSLSLLHLAVCHNRIDIIKSLLSHPDINPEIKDSLDRTPIEFAQKFGEERREIIEILAEVRKDKTSPVHILPVSPGSCPASLPDLIQKAKNLSK